MPTNEPISYGSAVYLKQEVQKNKEALESYRQESRQKLIDLTTNVELSESLYRMRTQHEVDIPKMLQSLRYVAIRDPENFDPKHPEDLAVVEDAINWFGGIRRPYIGCLTDQFYGVKNYDGFYHQRTDCEYGYGPRHGSIVFAIGLCLHVRSEIRRHFSDPSVSDQHRSAYLPVQIRENCIYFLEAFKQGKIEPNAINLWHPNRDTDRLRPEGTSKPHSNGEKENG